MTNRIFVSAGHSAALQYAISALTAAGCRFVDTKDTSAKYLLLPVPSFSSDGKLTGGGDLTEILPELPKDITVIGGNLKHPALTGYKCLDLLQDPVYVSKNANITAHCAIKQAMQALPITLQDCPVAIIGWGRIGKCLGRLLRQLGANVSIAARKETDRAMIEALGYHSETIPLSNAHYRVVFNTAPEMVLPKEECAKLPHNCLKIDLASIRGIEDEATLWARGLPSKDTPESSGTLIAQRILALVAGKE